MKYLIMLVRVAPSFIFYAFWCKKKKKDFYLSEKHWNIFLGHLHLIILSNEELLEVKALCLEVYVAFSSWRTAEPY